MVSAKFAYPENGTAHHQETAKKYLHVGHEYEVSQIIMGQSYTSVYLSGIDCVFNSVMFDFYENGNDLNIFRDNRFNPYIRKEK